MGESSEIFDRLRRIEEMLARMDERDKSRQDDTDDHEDRIRALELESAKRKGIMTVIATIGGVVGSVAVWIVKHFAGGGS